MTVAAIPHRSANAGRDVRRPNPLSFIDLGLAALIPFTQLISINVGGFIFGQDLMAVLLLPFLLSRPGAWQKLGQVRTFFILLGVWFLAQVVTDLIRHSASEDYLRGWLKIVFFGAQFAMLWLLLTRGFRPFIVYVLSLGVMLIFYVHQRDPAEAAFPWKFGLGIGLVYIAAAIGCLLPRSRRDGFFPHILVMAAGTLSLFHDSRSVAGTAILAGAYGIVASWVLKRPQLSKALTPKRFAIVILSGLLCAQALLAGYGGLARSGFLGKDARDKYIDQSSGDVGLIQGGRVESLVSVVAIKDSPIIGHGSWAHDMTYVRMLTVRLRQLGIRDYRADSTEGDSDNIPTHSHILGAWVEAGVAGAIFWGWVFCMTIVSLYYALKIPRLPLPIIVISSLVMLWDIPFSPFGADQRFLRAAQIAIILYTIHLSKLALERQAAGALLKTRSRVDSAT